MFIQSTNDRSSKAKWGRKGLKTVHYPDDSAQAVTTIHCRRTTAKSVRTTVVRECLPLDARREYCNKSFEISRARHDAEKRMQEERRCKFDAYFVGKGIWAVAAWVSVETGEVITCEFTTNQAPVLSSPLRKYGSFRTFGTVFHSADVVKRFAY